MSGWTEITNDGRPTPPAVDWHPQPWSTPATSASQSPGARTGTSTVGADAPDFIPQVPLRTLDDLVVPDRIRARLESALRLLEHHDLIYRDWDLQRLDPHRTGVAVNLYGPPGTGKSLAAEALAATRSSRFIDVNYAELESKYVSQTSKNIVECFRQAEYHQAVLIFNEADSILGARLSEVTQSADHSVNMARSVMLTQLDHFGGLVIFTTNFARNYDTAFVRRILTHVRFELPDSTTRRQLWERVLPQAMPGVSDLTHSDLELLTEKSEGLAGGDLVNAVVAAAAHVASRDGADRRLQARDVLQEIEIGLQTRHEVGRMPGGRDSAAGQTPRGEVRVIDVQQLDQVPSQETDDD